MSDDTKRQVNNLKSSNVKIVLLLALFSVLFILPLISAVQIEMKDVYSQGETLIAKISGNFVDAPTLSNILIYREHTRIPTQFTLSKIESDYYLYAWLSNKIAGNYSLQIQDLRYKVGTQTKEDDIIKNFTITNETADFYVSPGFASVSDDFSLELINLQDNKITIDISYDNSSGIVGFFESLFGSGSGSSTQTVELSSGQTKKVNFNFDDSLNESKFTTVNLSSEKTSYSIPVYMEVNGTKKTTSNFSGKLAFEPSLFNISMATNSNTSRIIYLTNKESLSVENISIYVSDSLKPYISFSVNKLDELDGNSSQKIEFFIKAGADEENIEGQIIASYENNSEELFAYSSIFLNFIKDYIPQYNNTDNLTVIDTKTCAQLNGTICTADETCSGESVYAKDNKCCVSPATCNATQQSSTLETIGWSLVAIIVIFAAWFFLKRYRKVRTNVDLLKIAKGKN